MKAGYPSPTQDPACIHFAGLNWNYDPAASGPRERAFLVNGWELKVYYDGRWVVEGPGDTQAQGCDADLAAAQARAVDVARALGAEITSR